MNCNDHKHNYKFSRRDFLTKTSLGMGALTVGSLISPSNLYSQNNSINKGHSNFNINPQLAVRVTTS